MTGRTDLDRRVASWMNEIPARSAQSERFQDVVTASARVRPRPRWLAAFGSEWVDAPGLPGSGRRPALPREVLVAIAVGLLVVALLGVQAIGRANLVAPRATETPRPSRPALELQPTTPVALPPAGDLNAGTYSLANPCTGACADYTEVVFTVPGGWATKAGFITKHDGEPDEVAISFWQPNQVYDDPCHWQTSTESPVGNYSLPWYAGWAPTNEAGGLGNQKGRGPVPRPWTELALGNVVTLKIDLSVPGDLNPSSCDAGAFRTWLDWDGKRAASRYAPGQLDTVFQVQVDRRSLLVDASHMPGSSDQDLAELDAVLASMVITGGYPDGNLLIDEASGEKVCTSTATRNCTPMELTLAPGTYTAYDFEGYGYNLQFAVPAGWSWHDRYLSKGPVGLPDGAAIYFYNGPVIVYADPCHWSTGGTEAASVGAFARAIGDQKGRSATIPVARKARSLGGNGWGGTAIQLASSTDVSFAGCDGGEYRSWGPDVKSRGLQGPDQLDLVWAVDLNSGGDTTGPYPIIDAASFPDTSPTVISEIQAILDSVLMGHWG